MFSLLGWVIYGLIVGSLARVLHPGDEPSGCLPTILIGVAGSYVGGVINWILGSGDPFSASGVVMGVIGGVIACYAYQYFQKKA
jgi:uncharacterized membrane protein YeaQ/YmgE (transglycosylase-associated protein family)